MLIQNMTQKKIAQIPKKIIQVKQLPEVHQKIFEGELEQKGGGENHRENDKENQVQAGDPAALSSLIDHGNKKEENYKHRKVPEVILAGEAEKGKKQLLFDSLFGKKLRVQQSILQKIENLPDKIQKKIVQAPLTHEANGSTLFTMGRSKEKRTAYHDKERDSGKGSNAAKLCKQKRRTKSCTDLIQPLRRDMGQDNQKNCQHTDPVQRRISVQLTVAGGIVFHKKFRIHSKTIIHVYDKILWLSCEYQRNPDVNRRTAR